MHFGRRFTVAALALAVLVGGAMALDPRFLSHSEIRQGHILAPFVSGVAYLIAFLASWGIARASRE